MGYATRCFLSGTVYIESIAVAPEFRGLGFGRQHLREIVATSRKPAASLVADGIPGALDFFLKSGFLLNDCDVRVPKCLPGAATNRFALVSHPGPWTEKERATFLEEVARKVCPDAVTSESRLSSPDAAAERP